MFGLFKQRSAFGDLLDAEGITQRKFARKAGISEDVVSRMCNDDDYEPSTKTYRRAQKGLYKLRIDEDIADYFD